MTGKSSSSSLFVVVRVAPPPVVLFVLPLEAIVAAAKGGERWVKSGGADGNRKPSQTRIVPRMRRNHTTFRFLLRDGCILVVVDNEFIIIERAY